MSAPRLPIPPPPQAPRLYRRRARHRLRAVLLAGCLVLAGTAGCGSSKPPGAKAGATAARLDRPPVRLATKNFTEQFILGQLYKQALEAKGFRVVLKQDVGSSELVDQALTSGDIDLYPEYIGVIVSEIAHDHSRQRTPAATYRRAKAFEARRGFAVLAPSPGADALANAVTPATARRHHLRTTADLRRLGRFRYGGPPENRTRVEGAIGMRRVYGLRFRYVPLIIGERYKALDQGRVDVTQVFSTEGQLADRSRYVVLDDPEGLFGHQNIAPVVNRRVLRRQGPGFAKALDAVSVLLTDAALQRMNGDVDLRGKQPADVARAFLREHGLL